MGHGTECVTKYDLDSLSVIGSVGEPINEEAWIWYHDNIGNKKCPVVDTWWQTETGGTYAVRTWRSVAYESNACCYQLPLPGIQPVLLNAEGEEITTNDTEGYPNV